MLSQSAGARVVPVSSVLVAVDSAVMEGLAAAVLPSVTALAA
jgi:hypothetical protein